MKTQEHITQQDRKRNVSLKLTHSEYHFLKKRAYAKLQTVSKYVRETICQPL
jgi:uncharacterized protein (DUF1778 family)